jgi:hypothetical protein
VKEALTLARGLTLFAVQHDGGFRLGGKPDEAPAAISKNDRYHIALLFDTMNRMMEHAPAWLSPPRQLMVGLRVFFAGDGRTTRTRNGRARKEYRALLEFSGSSLSASKVFPARRLTFHLGIVELPLLGL